MPALIPREFINEIIAKTDIVELIDARVALKKAGRNYQACCPFHDEKSPSFTVSSSKQFYHCFGCGTSGNAIGFLMAYENKTFPEAVESLASALGIEIPRLPGQDEYYKNKSKTTDLYESLEKTSQYYRQVLKNAPHAIDYLKNRGLSGEIGKVYRIGYAPDRTEFGYDVFSGRIIFPIRDRQGRVVGFGGRLLEMPKNSQQPKYLNSPESPIFHKSYILYGLYEALQANKKLKLSKILVVEGYMDVVSLAQAGITFAAATLGTATSPQHITQLFQQVSHIIFCFDGDNAGQKAAWRALESALSRMRDGCQVQFLFLPDGEDPDSLIKKIGKNKFLLLLEENTQNLADFFFQHLKSQTDTHSVEGRTKLLSLALPYIETITDAPIFREMITDQLSDIVRFEKSRFPMLIKSAQTTVKNSEAKNLKRIKSVKIERTPMRLAIALVLQYPFLVTDLILKNPSNYSFLMTLDIDLPGILLLKKILSLLNTHFNSVSNLNKTYLTTAGILEHFRETPECDLLHKLAAWETHNVPESGILAEWQGILRYFEKNQDEKLIEKYKKKAYQQKLTDAEKQDLQRLIINTKK